MAKVIAVKPGENLSSEALKEVSTGVKACKIAAFPTDTVYGIGSTGLIKAAMRRIYQVKGRDSAKPLPVLVKSIEEAKKWVEWTPQADALARKYWPGPLTLVLRPTKEGRILTFQEFPTIAVRVPAHPIILSILNAADIPLISTSANLSGQPTITSGGEISSVLGELIDFIIDAGPITGVESTVVDATSATIRVLREGKLTRDEITHALSN